MHNREIVARMKHTNTKLRGQITPNLFWICLCGVLVLATPVAAHAGTQAPMLGKPKLAQMPAKQMLQQVRVNDATACAPNDLALAGIDVVSYHRATGPLMGSSEFALEYQGLNYQFVSAAHQHEFAEDPASYIPQYLGWCATSLALGGLACPNPLNYKLENGLLLLFETTGFTNGKLVWNSDPGDFRSRADANLIKFLDGAGS